MNCAGAMPTGHLLQPLLAAMVHCKLPLPQQLHLLLLPLRLSLLLPKVTFAADAFFDFDKAVLKPAGKAKLDEVANKIGGINLEVIIAVGHTDSGRLGCLQPKTVCASR